MLSHRGRSYKSELTWPEGKSLLNREILLQDLQDDLLDQFYTLHQGNLCVIDNAKKEKRKKEEEPSCFLIERFFYKIFKMIFLINFYTLQQGNLCVIDYAKKEIFFKCGILRSECMSVI
jgi:hypothetical protein